MPIQRWRCPLALQAKSAVFAAAGMAMAAVFLPLWFAIPVMVVLGAWGLGICVRRSEVVLDAGLGRLTVRLGPIARRVPLASITAVAVDQGKVSIARSDGGEISVYAWRKSRLDGWLRMPVVAGDIGHAIANAATRAADAAGGADGTDGRAAAGWREGRRPRPRSRSREAATLALLACTGVLEVAAALLVRVSWPNPLMTALGVILALALGLSGVFYILFALWLLVRGRAPGAGRALA
ncbi:MAG TPA: hypothetical protein VKG80_04405 [Trebonia sp.]|nr:hypothetical protein [Trebonia sp.]